MSKSFSTGGRFDEFDENVLSCWENLVSNGKKCGAGSVAKEMIHCGCEANKRQVDSSFKRLERAGYKLPRGSHSSKIPDSWRSPPVDKSFFPLSISNDDVGFQPHFPDDENSRLRDEIIELRKILEYATHHKDSDLQGGTFTINCSDLHYTNSGHLINTCISLEEKSVELIRRFAPRKIIVSINGDVVQGRGIYRNQHLDNVVAKAMDQIKAASFRVYEFHKRLTDNFPETSLEYYVTQGNHDYSKGDSTAVPFVWACRQLGLVMTYCGFRHILNIADSDSYNVLVKHGYGNSSYSPSAPKLIHETLKEVLTFQNRGYIGDEKIHRVWHGHTHWRNVGTEYTEGLVFDVTGGLHRNDRANLGLNNRPCGWIGYVSPVGSSDILSPIEIIPDRGIYNVEIDDPELTERNRTEAARCIMGFNSLAEQLGIIKRGLGE